MSLLTDNSIGNLVLELTADGREYFAELKEVENQTQSTADNLVKAFEYSSAGILATLGTIAVVGVKNFATLESSVVKGTANMKGATSELRREMEDLSIDLSNAGADSAEEISKGFGSFASNGKTAVQALKDIKVADEFATAANMGVAQSADALAKIQAQLGMSSNDAAEDMKNMQLIADTLTKAAGLGGTSIEGMTQAIAGLGPQLTTMNGGLNEAASLIAAMTSKGIDAGTASSKLWMILRTLTSEVNNNQQTWKMLGLNLVDAEGNMLPLSNIIAQLDQRMSQLTNTQKMLEMEQLGFSGRSYQAMQSVMGLGNQLKDLQSELTEVNGATKEVADVQMETFSSAFKNAFNIVENSTTIIGTQLVPTLQGVKNYFDMTKGSSDEFKDSLSTVSEVIKGVFLIALASALDIWNGFIIGLKTGSVVILALSLAVTHLYLEVKTLYNMLTALGGDGANGIKKLSAEFGNATTTSEKLKAVWDWVKSGPSNNDFANAGKELADFTKDIANGTDVFSKSIKETFNEIKILSEKNPGLDLYNSIMKAEEAAQKAKSSSDLKDATESWAKLMSQFPAFNAVVTQTGTVVLPGVVVANKLLKDSWDENLVKLKSINDAFLAGQISIQDYTAVLNKMNLKGAAADPIDKVMVNIRSLNEEYNHGSQLLDQYDECLRNGKMSIDQYNAAVAAGVMTNTEYAQSREKMLKSFTFVTTGSDSEDAIKKLREQISDEMALYADRASRIKGWETLTQNERIQIEQAANAKIKADTQKANTMETELYLQKDQMVLNSAASLANNLSDLLGKQTTAGKMAFIAAKAIAVAQAIVDTNLAAASARKIDPYGVLSTEITALGYANAAVIAAQAIASYDGGGYTPSGSRMGGVDGKGGFLSILHPDEKVTDLTRPDKNNGLESQGTGPIINIHNYAGVEVTTQSSSSGKVIDILLKKVEERVHSDIMSGNGKIPQAIERTYGVGRGRKN